MNKLLIYTVFFHTLLFTSCYNEEVNLSKLKNSISENFIISSIEQRVNGEIYCIGEFKDNKIVEVRRYNQKFELQEKWQPGIILNLTGDMKIDHLNMGGWLISNNLKDSPKSLSIYKTDENFNILHQWNKIISNDAVLNLSALKELKNGDLMIAWDSITGTSVFNPSMVTFLKFNSKLDKIAEFYSSKSYSNYNSWSPRITESEDQKLYFFYEHNKNRSRPMSFFLTPIGGFMVGSFDRNLNVLFQNLILPDFTHTEIFGFSNTNNSLILNYAVNDEHLQYYQSFSKTNGDSIKSATLGFNYINNQIIKGYYYGHFPLGPANPLPENLKPGQGHFIYSEVDRKLKFVQVDENVNLTVKFPLLLPEFDEIISYRQLFTDVGTIIVGVSYGYKGRNYFTLQEITKNGELVK